MQGPHWVCLTACCLLGLSAPVEAATPAGRAAGDEGLIASPQPDWPQWRGPRRNGVAEETGLLAEWPDDGPTLLWRIGGLGRGWSSPIIANGTLYITGDVGDDLVVSAFWCYDVRAR